MATIHFSGTKLAPNKERKQFDQAFMYVIGFVFFIAMHFYTPNLGGSGLALPFNTSVWIVLSIAIAISCHHITTDKQLRYTKLSIFFFISCLIMTLPILYPNNNYWFVSIPRLIALWSGWVFFIALQQVNLNNQSKQRLLWFIIIAVLLEAILGYCQYFSLLPEGTQIYNDFEHTPLGVFQNSSAMLSFLSTGFILSGYLLARQKKKYGQKISRILLLYFIPLITIPLIILLAQELEWVGTVIGGGLIATHLYRTSSLRRLSGWIYSSIIGTGLGFILLSTYPLEENNFPDPEVQINTLFPQAIDMLIEKPFTGYGYGRFEAEHILYTARQHQLNPDYPVGFSTIEHPLNEMLYWGVEGGFVPILGILLSATVVLLKIYSTRKGTRLATFSLFIPIVLYSQIGASFYQSAVHWLIFIILLFWVDQRSSKFKFHSISKTGKTVLGISRFIIPTIVFVYMLGALQTSYILLKYEQSSPKDSRILQQIISPIAQKQNYEWQVYSSKLSDGLRTKKVELIEQYINWSIQTIKQYPKKHYYIGLIAAYQGLGKISKANQIRTEAKFLFPKYDFSTVTTESVMHL